MARYKAAEVAESERWLRELLEPADSRTVYLILRHRSASGMTHDITPLIFPAGGLRYLGYNIARLMGLRWMSDCAAVRVSGAGMDMGFYLISGVSQRLYGDPYAITHSWL